MEHQFEEIREQQRASWNTFSIGWQKWDCLLMGFEKPMGNEIIRMLNPKEADHVLMLHRVPGNPGFRLQKS